MVTIIGRGNVASHFYEALKYKTEVCMVNPRTLENLPENSDYIILAVSDNSINELAERIPTSNAIIAHTSGSIPMDVLKKTGNNYGVFYPLQTFTKGLKLNYSEIPVFIEGSSNYSVSKLKDLAALFSNDIREADSDKRRKLHLASVFACNFTNKLAGIANNILRETDIDFSALLPLMKQTVDKLAYLSPEESQTGPAVRGDTTVMEKHLMMLDKQPELQDLYKTLSSLISKDHVSKI